MPEEGAYWREEKCGCRYLMKRTNSRFFQETEQVDIEYCNEHHRRWVFIDCLTANARQRKRILNSLDAEDRKYVEGRLREKGLVT
jgi:hypothetical protein